MDSLSLTNRTPGYYVNWEKVKKNTQELELSLHTLNYLIGKDNIYNEEYDLFKKQTELIKAIPTILAIRDKRFDVLYIEKDMKLSFENLDFKTIDSNIELYVDFAYETGLLDFLSTKANKSLVDYVF